MLTAKDKELDKQKREIETLNNDNSDLRANVAQMRGKLEEEKKKARNLQANNGVTAGANEKDLEEIRALQLAIQFEE